MALEACKILGAVGTKKSLAPLAWAAIHTGPQPYRVIISDA